MTNSTLILRGDVLSSIDLFPNTNAHQGQLVTQSHIKLIGRQRARNMERLTFLIDGFDEKMTYFIDFGDGNCRRILGRKFHYQYQKAGLFNMLLSFREGDQMLPVCDHRIEIMDFSWKSVLNALNMF